MEPPKVLTKNSVSKGDNDAELERGENGGVIKGGTGEGLTSYQGETK